MARYVCPICGYVYDEEADGRPCDANAFTCPVRGAMGVMFAEEEVRQKAAAIVLSEPTCFIEIVQPFATGCTAEKSTPKDACDYWLPG